MNERIKELKNLTLNKHFSYTWTTMDEVHPLQAWTTMDYDDMNRFAEKFAEVIVAECCTIADDWVNNYNDGENYPSERIKEHFGVEK